ncbi:allophanate hydrolase-related protein [Mesorhizobium australicum]|uniref:allophanate hydrolase-related protein n=1 Tax=Mesorhizobium australicum TaxID=536018 RepID=UPI003EBE64D8
MFGVAAAKDASDAYSRATRTAAAYRLYAGRPIVPKPGLVRVENGGTAIDVEVWRLPADAFGHFVAATPPLGYWQRRA